MTTAKDVISYINGLPMRNRDLVDWTSIVHLVGGSDDWFPARDETHEDFKNYIIFDDSSDFLDVEYYLDRLGIKDKFGVTFDADDVFGAITDAAPNLRDDEEPDLFLYNREQTIENLYKRAAEIWEKDGKCTSCGGDLKKDSYGSGYRGSEYHVNESLVCEKCEEEN